MTRMQNVIGPAILFLVLFIAAASFAAAGGVFHSDGTVITDASKRLDGDCRDGSYDLDAFQGYYSDFWAAGDAYAVLITPGDGSCSCTEGVTVQDVHMAMCLQAPSTLIVQAELWSAADGGGGCLIPLAPLASSSAFSFSYPGAGNVNMEIPFGSPCLDPFDDYFIVVRYLPGSTSVFCGVPVDDSPGACTTWVNRAGLAGWHDVVAEYGWLGNFYVYADLNCCSDPVAEERTTWGDLKAVYR